MSVLISTCDNGQFIASFNLVLLSCPYHIFILSISRIILVLILSLYSVFSFYYVPFGIYLFYCIYLVL